MTIIDIGEFRKRKERLVQLLYVYIFFHCFFLLLKINFIVVIKIFYISHERFIVFF